MIMIIMIMIMLIILIKIINGRWNRSTWTHKRQPKTCPRPTPASCRQASLCLPVLFGVFFHLGKS